MRHLLDSRSIFLRKQILTGVIAGKRGHIGSAFSIVEILRVLYDEILRFDPKNPMLPNRDRFVLSKGHGCLALYAMLADKGFFPHDELSRFCHFDGILGGHPDHRLIPGVEISTGSLGHGLPMGVGMALGIRLNQESRIKNQEVSRKKKTNERTHDSIFMIHDSIPKVFVLLGDGECNEGSVWEAAQSAGKYKLDNLIVLIDSNKMMTYAPTETVQGIEPLADKWKSFGFAVSEVNGHDLSALREIVSDIYNPKTQDPRPKTIICHTIKGKGIPSIENNAPWHHKSKISEEEVHNLMKELERS